MLSSDNFARAVSRGGFAANDIPPLRTVRPQMCSAWSALLPLGNSARAVSRGCAAGKIRSWLLLFALFAGSGHDWALVWSGCLVGHCAFWKRQCASVSGHPLARIAGRFAFGFCVCFHWDSFVLRWEGGSPCEQLVRRCWATGFPPGGCFRSEAGGGATPRSGGMWRDTLSTWTKSQQYLGSFLF